MRFVPMLVSGVVLAGVLATPAAPASAAGGSLTVETTSGRLHGLATAHVREFLGVRYAEPPTGPRRWTLPVAAPHADGTVDATKPGASCAQSADVPGGAATDSLAEDCLFLNVTTPRDAGPGDRLPVMVWWHGGGFTSGSGAAYDAHRLADQGHVIVVTINYRLGVFGYLSLPGLPGSGDFGLADQILATRWAKTNAAAFGGNPDNITVFGESAGAMSACALLTSPAAAGLVDKVAMSSGGTCELNWPQDGLVPGAPPQTPYVDVADGRALGTAEAAELGCTGTSSLACLRAKPTKALLRISPSFSNVLAYGTKLLPTDPATAVQRGKALDIPVLASGNRDEERAFVGGAELVKPYFTATTYPKYLTSAFGEDAGRVAAEYPQSAYPSAAIAWSTVITDRSWACPTLSGDLALSAHSSPVYSAEFADRDAPDVNGVETPTFDPGAAHASDVPYLFDLLGKSLLRTPAQRALSATMIGYWTSFARTGVPAVAGQPRWPAVSGVAGPTLQFVPRSTALVDAYAEHRCAFWANIAA